MNDVEISFAPSPQDLQQLAAAVIRHDRASIGAGSPQPLACWLREDGRLVGGASGRMELRRLYVEFLWVDGERRAQGLGGRLLRNIEQAARGVGCTECLIESLSGATAAFYRRAGYRDHAFIEDYIPGLSLYVLLKNLA